MKKFGGGAFPRFTKGACYQLKTNKFFDVLEIIGAGFTGEFNGTVSPAEDSFTSLTS